jgi:hypothetical protein
MSSLKPILWTRYRASFTNRLVSRSINWSWQNTVSVKESSSNQLVHCMKIQLLMDLVTFMECTYEHQNYWTVRTKSWSGRWWHAWRSFFFIYIPTFYLQHQIEIMHFHQCQKNWQGRLRFEGEQGDKHLSSAVFLSV